MRKYILIGIPKSGKTTLGKRAAEALLLPFFDTDQMAQKQLSIRSQRDFFRATFNGSFEDAQQKAIYELAKLDTPAIISTGAEVALIPPCAKVMRCMGTIIHIERPAEIILEMMANDGVNRLVMVEDDGTEIVMEEQAVKLYAKELPHYKALANLTLENTGTEDEALEKLLAQINGLKVE